MENTKSVGLLEENKTVQPFQPIHAIKFAPDVSWTVDGDDTDDWRNWAKNIDVKSWVVGKDNDSVLPSGKPKAPVNTTGGNVPGQPPPTKQPTTKWKNDTIYAKDLSIKHVSDESCLKWKRIGTRPHRACVPCIGEYDMVYAKELSIAHGKTPYYWKWKTLPEMPMSEAAELLNVCWLEVTGKYDMKFLVPRRTYTVTFVIKIENNVCFDSPVKFTLTLPDKEIVKHVNLMELKGNTNCLIFVKMGHVEGTGCGEIKFSLTNLSSCWKRGITIVGVCIELTCA